MATIISPLALALLVSACASKGAPPKDVRATDVCAELEAETRARIDALRSDLATGLVWEALGAIGRCVGEPSVEGRWAVVLGDELVIESAQDEDPDTGELSEVYFRVRAEPRAMFVTRDGKRVTSDIALPEVDQIRTATGEDYVPPWSYYSFLLDSAAFDWAGRASPQLAVFNDWRVVLLTWTGAGIETYAPSKVLDTVTSITHLDRDGRVDLADADYFALQAPGAEEIFPLVLVAHAQPDGTFALDDAVTRAYYAEQCAGLGKAPWITGRDERMGLRNITCARIYGVDAAVILAALRGEARTAKDGELPLNEALEDWFTRALPVTLTR